MNHDEGNLLSYTSFSLFLVPACSTSHLTDYMMKVSQILFQSVHCIAGYVKTREAIAAEHSYPLSPLTYKVWHWLLQLKSFWHAKLLLIWLAGNQKSYHCYHYYQVSYSCFHEATASPAWVLQFYASSVFLTCRLLHHHPWPVYLLFRMLF